jgi:hypothetical protein
MDVLEEMELQLVYADLAKALDEIKKLTRLDELKRARAFAAGFRTAQLHCERRMLRAGR